eukprot:817276_1
MSSPEIIEHARHQLDFSALTTAWVPTSSRFIVAGQSTNGQGRIDIMDLSQGQSTTLFKRIVTTCIMVIRDLERLDTSIFSVCAHDKSINTLDGCGGLGIGNGSPEIATGGAEGCVKLWDPRQIKPVITLQSKDDRISRDCWSVCFGNSFNSTNRCLAAGYDNGDVKLVDLRTTKILWSTNVSNGVVNIEFDRKDIEMNKLLITSLESQFRVYNLKMLKSGAECPHVLQKAHDATVWLGKHLPQNRDLFATLGGNGTIKIWKFFYSKKLRGDDFNYKQNNEFGILELVAENTLTDQPIVSFDWNKEKSGLALVCALDQTCRIIYLSSKE